MNSVQGTLRGSHLTDSAAAEHLLLPEIVAKPGMLAFDQWQHPPDDSAVLLKAAGSRYGLIVGMFWLFI